MHPVAVFVHVLGDLAVRTEGCREHEADVVLDQDIAGAVPHAGLQARVGDRGEAPQGPIVGGRLLGVGDPELDVVDALEGEEVLRLGGCIGVDDGTRLVGGAASDGLSHRASPWLAPMLRRASILVPDRGPSRHSLQPPATAVQRGRRCRRSTVGAAVRVTSIILSTAAASSSGER